MKKAIMTLFWLISLQSIFAQNLIPNGDFETLNSYNYNGYSPNFFNSYVPNWVDGCPNGTQQGTPDIFSTQNTLCFAGVPINKYANNLPSRLAGTKNYAGMLHNLESLRCGISQPLLANRTYTLSFYAALEQGTFDCNGTMVYPALVGSVKIKATLKKSSDPCNGGLDILISQPINHGTWQNVTGTFTLSSSQALQGYDRIEFKTSTGYYGAYFYMDDVSLNGPPLIADFNFVTIGQTYTNVSTPYGPEQLTQVCASPSPIKTPVLINGSASTNEIGYGISIQEFNPTTYIGGTVIYNNWIPGSVEVPATDININNLTGVNMQIGQIYLVTLFVGPTYTYKSKLFRINPLPTINAGADRTLCSADGINITTNSWPVKVYKGGTLMGTFSSNPIILPAASNANYNFITTNSLGCSAQDDANLTLRQCSRASFFFKNPLSTSTQVPSQYGPQQVSHICSPYKIDGSASTDEDGYHLRIQEFDISTWSFLGNPLYLGWYASGPVGNDIDLYTVVQSVGNSFTYGKIYFVGLSVGPDWHSDTKFFKAIDCTKSNQVAAEKEQITLENVNVFPNPTDGIFTVMLNGMAASKIKVTNIIGNTVFSSLISEEDNSIRIDIQNLPSGVYIVNIEQQNGEQIVKKIIKK